MKVYQNLLTLIGNTPIVKVNTLDTGCCSLYLKLENLNPSSSIKDRMALSMVDAAEKEGVLKPGGTIVEATSGNTGLGLALVAALRGYKLIIVYPDKFSKEKAQHLRAMGAEIVTTRSDVAPGHPEHYDTLAATIAEKEKGLYINQFANPANPLAHEKTTAKEIWEQMEGDVDAVVCGVGSSGTITGISRYFQKTAPKVEVVLADPVGSILAHYIKTGELLKEAGSWAVEGIGEDYIPPVADLSHVKKAYSVSDKESFEIIRHLLRREGIFAGPSTGVLVGAALQYCREQKEHKNVLTFVCDTGSKYLSKAYNDYWMIDNGFLERPVENNLLDLISRRHQEGNTITLNPDHTLNIAVARMKINDVSQLPVLEGEKIVGILDESDLLMALYRDNKNLKILVKEVMTSKLEKVSVNTSLEEVMKIINKGLVVIVEEREKFLGLITQMDLINHLRQKLHIS
ncbi:MAG: pyridoxal-phosphate dependent enzyme [Proteobacteria bacterium]|nr:pyridoxal-phosphate dependent enzyme [Pseudomonadota bacterium]